jgi:hydrogenase maturation protease
LSGGQALPSPASKAEPGPREKILILGLGNPILGDDSVGLRVAAALRRLPLPEHVVVQEDYWGGLRLMESMIGYRRAVVLDAMVTGAPPGTIRVLEPGSLPTQRSASAHDVNLLTALEVGRAAGAPLPKNEDIQLVAIEAADVLTFSEQLSPEVEAAIPRAVRTVLDLLKIHLEVTP